MGTPCNTQITFCGFSRDSKYIVCMLAAKYLQGNVLLMQRRAASYICILRPTCIQLACNKQVLALATMQNIVALHGPQRTARAIQNNTFFSIVCVVFSGTGIVAVFKC